MYSHQIWQAQWGHYTRFKRVADMSTACQEQWFATQQSTVHQGSIPRLAYLVNSRILTFNRQLQLNIIFDCGKKLKFRVSKYISSIEVFPLEFKYYFRIFTYCVARSLILSQEQYFFRGSNISFATLSQEHSFFRKITLNDCAINGSLSKLVVY